MIKLLMYVYAFMLPIFDKAAIGREVFLVYIIILAALGVISTIYRPSMQKVFINKYFILYAVIIGFGVLGALLHGINALHFRYSLSVIFLLAIMLLVNKYLSSEQVANMFLFYGLGLLAGIVIGGTGGGGRLHGNIVSATNLQIMPPLIIAVCFMKIIQSSSKFYKCVLLCLSVFLIYLSVLSQNRINFILLSLVGIYFIAVYRDRFQRYKTLISIFLPIIFLTLMTCYYQTQYRLGSLISVVKSPENVLYNPEAVDFSIQTRFEYALAGIKIFFNNPLGVGFGNFQYFATQYVPSIYRIGHPHNTYIEILVSTGIGGTLFSVFLFCYLYKKLKGNSFMKLMLLMLLVAGFVDTLIYDKILLLLFVSADILNSNGGKKQD